MSGSGTGTPSVGGTHYFSIAELRAFDSGLSNATKFPDAALETARDRAESVIENAARVSFVSRTASETLSGYDQVEVRSSSCWRLWVEWPKATSLTSVTVDGTAMGVTELADVHLREFGALDNEASWTDGVDNIVVVYTHGYATTPEPVKRAAMILTRYYAVGTALPDRAIGEATDVGFIRYTLAGRDGTTGLPEVDAIIGQYGRAGRAIG